MMKKTILSIFLIPLLISSFLFSTRVDASSHPSWRYDPGATRIAPQLQTILDRAGNEQMFGVILTLVEQAELRQVPGADRAARQEGVVRALQATAQRSQGRLLALLASYRAEGKVAQVLPFWGFNGLSLQATQDVILELASHPDVALITPDQVDIIPAAPAALSAPEPNLSLVNAPALWDLGYYGQGVVVANLDSGVDLSHPDLASRYRGGSNSWFDPYGQHASPYDMSGHGTQTMGLMLAGDAGGTTIGVAPQAQWIAVKIFNDSGSSTATAIHLGYQWLLDPDGNPGTPDAPHVVNNSWVFGAPGCNLEFQLDLQALHAAGILPVFSAGNYGPGSGTSASPANYPEALAVGAVNNSDLLYAYSSRGPSACGEAQAIYPELVAPGVNIQTTDRYGFYTSATGTSLAAPHVSGALALLLSAFPSLSPGQQQAALLNGAADLGFLGPDNDFGYGRLDALASFHWLLENANLAQGMPVSVSSAQDAAHTGPMAVDGDLASMWQTALAKGKTRLPSEWISVDLGGSRGISRAVLEWDANYATAYTLQVSNDNLNWSTVFSTLSGNGLSDVLDFAPVTARYVRLDTTAWSSGSLRVWLKEFQVFAGGGSSPTPTPPPSPTPTPTATPTPPASLVMHIGDLDGQSSVVNRRNWSAALTVWVHDASENPVPGATVSGAWSGGISAAGSCTTAANGSCQILSGSIRNEFLSVTFTVSGVVRSADSYNTAANHDPDGDSTGSSLTVVKP